MTLSFLTPTHGARPHGGVSGAQPRLRLLPSGDGWSLVGFDGKLVYSALGTSGRRRCVEFARAEGILTLGR